VPPDRRRPLAPAFLTRAYPLPVDMLIIAGVIAVWQLLRIPLEGSTSISLAHAHDWLALERKLHVDIEPPVLRFVHGRDWLYDGAKRFYANFDATFVIGFMAIARLLDPLRYPKLRTAYVLLHVPALAILALYPLAPPHWLAGFPFADGPPAHPSALRNETAAAVSLHFGDTIFIVAGLLWLRPRAPLAWLALLYPVVVFVVILGTGNHYLLDTLVGTACVLFGFAAAHVIHGPLPRAGSSATWLRVAVAGTGFALIAFAINGGFIGEVI
jgi:PAP2 superfamily